MGNLESQKNDFSFKPRVIRNKNLEDTIQSIMAMPPYQLPPITRTHKGLYVLDIEIGLLKFSVSGASWKSILKSYEQSITAAQPIKEFQELFNTLNLAEERIFP